MSAFWGRCLRPCRRSLCAGFLVAYALLCSGAASQRAEDIEHVKCRICGLAMEEAIGIAEKSDKGEEALSDAVEELCSVKSKKGRWLKKLDLQQEGDAVIVVRHEKKGNCKSECLTVQRACSKTLKGKEERLTKLLLRGTALADLQDEICKNACAVMPKPLRHQRKDEKFEPASDTTLTDLLSMVNGDESTGVSEPDGGKAKSSTDSSQDQAAAENSPEDDITEKNVTTAESTKYEKSTKPQRKTEHAAEQDATTMSSKDNETSTFWSELLEQLLEKKKALAAKKQKKKKGMLSSSQKDLKANSTSMGSAARNAEIEHIQCSICSLAVKEALHWVEKDGFKGRRQGIKAVVASVCNTNHRRGRWMTKLDLQQEGDGIVIYRHPEYGQCEQECTTIQHACAGALSGQVSQFISLLQQGAQYSTLSSSVCQKACTKKASPLKGQRVDEVFKTWGALAPFVDSLYDQGNVDEGGPTDTDETAQQGAGGGEGGGAGTTDDNASDLRSSANETRKDSTAGHDRKDVLQILHDLLVALTSQWHPDGNQQSDLVFRGILAIGLTLILVCLSSSRSPVAAVGCEIFSPVASQTVRSGKWCPNGSTSGAELLEQSEELVVLLASQEQRIRSSERLLGRSCSIAVQEAARARRLVEDMRNAFEVCSNASSSSQQVHASHHPDEPEIIELPMPGLEPICSGCGDIEPRYTCSGCGIPQYCSARCQLSHWSLHKTQCSYRSRHRRRLRTPDTLHASAAG